MPNEISLSSSHCLYYYGSKDKDKIMLALKLARFSFVTCTTNGFANREWVHFWELSDLLLWFYLFMYKRDCVALHPFDEYGSVGKQ